MDIPMEQHNILSNRVRTNHSTSTKYSERAQSHIYTLGSLGLVVGDIIPSTAVSLYTRLILSSYQLVLSTSQPLYPLTYLVTSGHKYYSNSICELFQWPPQSTS